MKIKLQEMLEFSKVGLSLRIEAKRFLGKDTGDAVVCEGLFKKCVRFRHELENSSFSCPRLFLELFGKGSKEAGFINDARKFFDDSVAVEFFRISYTNERKMGAAEEFFHVFKVATRGGMFFVAAVVDFDGADRADSAFIAKNEIGGFVFDEAVGFSAALAADLVTKERTKGNVGDNIEAFAEDFVEDLEAVSLGAGHELFFGAIVKALDSFAVITLIDYADKNGNNQKDEESNNGSSDKKCIHLIFLILGLGGRTRRNCPYKIRPKY